MNYFAPFGLSWSWGHSAVLKWMLMAMISLWGKGLFTPSRGVENNNTQ